MPLLATNISLKPNSQGTTIRLRVLEFLRLLSHAWIQISAKKFKRKLAKTPKQLVPLRTSLNWEPFSMKIQRWLNCTKKLSTQRKPFKKRTSKESMMCMLDSTLSLTRGEWPIRLRTSGMTCLVNCQRLKMKLSQQTSRLTLSLKTPICTASTSSSRVVRTKTLSIMMNRWSRWSEA